MGEAPVRRTDAGWVVDPDVHGVQIDSRRVEAGDIYVAIPGRTLDGRSFVNEAAARGALAVVAETPIPASPIPVVVVPSARRAAAELAAAVAGYPGRRLIVTGVTGTNGKTSVVYWLRHLLVGSGEPAGMLSSVENITGEPTPRQDHLTTPEAPDVQRALADMVRAGMRRAVLEVSSHGLVQHRVDEVPFRVAVLTNITREHLDFHGTMDAYIAAKRRLFTELLSSDGVAIFNADDPYSPAIRERVRQRTHDFGVLRGEVRARILQETAWSTRVRLIVAGRSEDVQVTVPAPGRYNVYNMLAAVTAALGQGVPFERIVDTLDRLPPVPGRLEKAAQGDGVTVLVDYAHTPDGLAQVLQTVRRAVGSQGRIWLVFGARGARDQGKRPIMGEIAARLADAVILTTDSPGPEEPARIAEDLARGLREAGSRPWAVELDRRAAIRLAVQSASSGDIVLVTGRGPEREQIFGDRRVVLDDREAAREAMAKRLSRPPAGVERG
jgi:UDP-N-acetylmuramoyl-L-alanyl-D-glutamate--2,6-diaminopimelate ligase